MPSVVLTVLWVVTRTLTANDCGIRTNLGARAALLTFGFINMRYVVRVKGNRAELTNVLTAVRKTSSASVGDFITAHRTLVASDLDYLDDVRILSVSAHRELNTFSKDRSFFIHTATHRRLIAGNDLLGNVHHILKKLILPCKASYLA